MDTVDTRSASVPEDGEKIIEIQLERLRTFKNHPFKVRMDQEMIRLSASVEKYGIIFDEAGKVVDMFLVEDEIADISSEDLKEWCNSAAGIDNN